MWNWLVNNGHIYQALVGWTVGVLMTGGFIGLIVRPTAKRIKRAWRKHEATQIRIADSLDASTPGGLGDLPRQLAEAVENIERGTE